MQTPTLWLGGEPWKTGMEVAAGGLTGLGQDGISPSAAQLGAHLWVAKTILWLVGAQCLGQVQAQTQAWASEAGLVPGRC